MRKSVRILFTIAALAIAVSSAAGKDEEVNFKYDKLLKKSFDELGDGSLHRMLITMTWVHENGRWQLLAGHAGPRV